MGSKSIIPSDISKNQSVPQHSVSQYHGTHDSNKAAEFHLGMNYQGLNCSTTISRFCGSGRGRGWPLVY